MTLSEKPSLTLSLKGGGVFSVPLEGSPVWLFKTETLAKDAKLDLVKTLFINSKQCTTTRIQSVESMQTIL